MVGVSVGTVVGVKVGRSVGVCVGASVGNRVGANVGKSVGETDGAIDGKLVSWHVMITVTLWRFPALSRRLTDSQLWDVPDSIPFGRRASLVPTSADW